MSSLVRTVALASTLVLLSASALAPRIRASAPAAPMASSSGPCALPLLDVTPNNAIGLASGWTIAQPFPATGTVVACSLRVSPIYGTGQYGLLQWDVAAMQPDPVTVALRSTFLNSSAMYYGSPLISWSPPVVLTALPHVAQPPGPTAAVVFTGTSGMSGFSYRTSTSGGDGLPHGVFGLEGSYYPLPGASTVQAISLCGGSSTLQALRIAQSVLQTDAVLDSTRWDVMQRFRVPQAVRLHWVEVALSGPPVSPYLAGSLQILGGGTGPAPPATLQPLVSATFSPYSGVPSWVSHYDFDSLIVLLPDTDYWLRVRTVYTFRLRAHVLSGAEGPDFAADIGPLWSRVDPDSAWVEQAGRALSFRLIGDPTNVVSVDPVSTPMRSPLELRATPNPSRGASLLTWSGATGGVRFEVLDARGRRVGSGQRGAGASGQWTWSASRADRPLAPGLYFVRATDDAGHAAFARVVLVR